MSASTSSEDDGGLQVTLVDRTISKDDQPPIVQMPPELLHEVMSYLPKKDVCRLMETSRSMWHSVQPRCVEVEAISNNFLLAWATYNGYQRVMRSIIEALKSRDDFKSIVNRPVECTFLPTVDGKALKTFPIHLAAMKDDVEAFKILMPSADSLHWKDGDGCSVLHYSRIYPNLSRIGLKFRHDPNEQDSLTKLTVLQRILSYDERRFIGPVPRATLDIVKVLLTEGNANPNKFEHQVQSPLCLAFQHSPQMVKLLLENGADPNFQSPTDEARDVETALVIAAGLPGGSEIVSLLVQHGANIDALCGSTSPLMKALECKQDSSAHILINSGANLNIYLRNPYNWKNPLIICAKERNWDWIKCLISKGADLNFPVVNLLSYAAEYLPLQDVQTLLDMGAIPDPPPTKKGTSPYVAALCSRKRGSVHRGNEAPKNDEAFEKERTAILDLLLKSGVKLHSEDMGADYSPVFQTLAKGGVKEMTRLLKDGASVKVIVQHERYPEYTPLHHVFRQWLRHGSEDIIDLLLRKGADPLAGYSEVTGARNTPLGVLIWDSGSAWTISEWNVAARFLKHRKVGIRITERFDMDTLAVMLFHSVAATEGSRRAMLNAVKRFASLTNYNNRWGDDGISGILDLIRLPVYWAKPWLFTTPWTGETEINPPLLGSARFFGAEAVVQLCAGGASVNVRELEANLTPALISPAQAAAPDTR